MQRGDDEAYMAFGQIHLSLGVGEFKIRLAYFPCVCKWSVHACSFAYVQIRLDLCECVSLLPHQASVEHQLPSYRGVMAKRKSFHPGAILQDQVGCLSLGEGEEQVMSKLSPKNNTFSFYEAGWRRLKTILGKKYSVEITKEGRRVLAV